MAKILFTGDFATVGRCQNYPLTNIKEVFSDIYPVINNVDLHVTNLECPLTKASTSILKTGPAIKSSPESIQFLIDAKVGVACLANNHLRDFGDKGIIDTLNICHKSQIRTVGGGENNVEAAKILYIKIKDKNFAFLNYCETEFSIATDTKSGANPIDYIQLFNDIRDARTKSDYVIVIYHGGNEYFSLPSPRIKNLFHHCIDLGADAVIGHHTHVFSGYEIYRGKPLVYSLGNFLFDEPDNNFEGWFTGLMAEISFDINGIFLKIHPIRQSKNELKIKSLKGLDKSKVVEEVNKLSRIISDVTQLNKAYSKFCVERGFNSVKAISNLTFFQKVLIKVGFPLEKVIGESNLRQTLNLLQCESHRDLIINKIKKNNS